LSLADDVASHLPELAALSILEGFTSDEKPITVPRKKAITLKHLLTHSSGLSYDAFEPRLMRWCKATGTPLGAKRGKTVPTRFDNPLLFEPGTSWGYSCSLDWAGLLVERVTGTDLDTYIQREILDKVGVKAGDITFWIDKFPEYAAKQAGVSIRGNGQSTDAEGEVRHMSVQNVFGEVEACMGGQGMKARLPAYLQVLKSLLADDGKILRKETLAMMFEPQLTKESHKALNDLRHTAPDQFNGFVGRMPDGVQLDWGLGGILTMKNDADIKGGWGRSKGTLMWSGLPNLFWFIDPEAGLCGMFGTQVVPPGDLKTEDLIVLFEKTMYERCVEAKGSKDSHKL
jgi:CubicO group peptidase (beta-lactamase class C family)